MARESASARVARAARILDLLETAYPDAHCALDHADPYQLLVATILSAQCTDVRVNLVTPALFVRFPDPRTLAGASQGEVEDLIRSTGFFRNKTANLLDMAAALVERHAGRVPDTMDELRALPGVGRKTANVVLGNAFDVPGITAPIVGARSVYVPDILRRLASTEFATQEGTLYPLLSKLRREELVQYEWQESDAGPPRKYYRLTDAGRAQLAELDEYWNLLNRTIANFGH